MSLESTEIANSLEIESGGFRISCAAQASIGLPFIALSRVLLFELRLNIATFVSVCRCLTNVAADKHFSDAASPQW